jgi:hypothetical protein
VIYRSEALLESSHSVRTEDFGDSRLLYFTDAQTICSFVKIEIMIWVKQKVTLVVQTVQIERDSLDTMTMTFVEPGCYFERSIAPGPKHWSIKVIRFK